MGEGRVIVIGDVHGCARELADLLDKLDVRPSRDEVVFVGDVINRGPDPCDALDLMRQVKGKAVLGNHEARLLRFRKTRAAAELKPNDWATARALRPKDWKWIAQWPLTRAWPRHNLIVVHAGFIPGIRWHKQPEEIITRVQMVNKAGLWGKRTQVRAGQPWANFWKGPETVVYGHTPRRNIHKRAHALGIDTGCVYGGHLTAYVLPERKIYQVPARKAYVG